MTNRFITESGLADELAGNYNFANSRFWIPEETTISGIPTQIGEIRHISSSGLVAVWDGTNWVSFTMTESVFTPSGIANMAAWYDAEHMTAVYTNTDNVSVWEDRSPNNLDGSANSSPNMVEPVAAINDKAAISYTGAEAHQTSTNVGNIRTVGCVFKRNAGGSPGVGSNDYIFSIVPDASHRLVLYIEGAASAAGQLAWVLEDNDSFAVMYTSGNGAIDANWHYAVCRIEPTGRIEMRLDGVVDGSGTHALGLEFNDVLNIGNWETPGSVNAFNGQIAELVFYDDYITDSEVSQLETYFQDKYGL